ncbi:hypothetical protein GUJ93_ZPchr0011g28536 [Zizania palustris]|uniref:Uncharacterized protein n=1 Tax=Zizania palustris TaxID=103762 RepID=A0A8J6BKQ4_ZIZPA|nr:hypothetical protein GUJ93_ZPchr0011g28536 [Zizania palustris]
MQWLLRFAGGCADDNGSVQGSLAIEIDVLAPAKTCENSSNSVRGPNYQIRLIKNDEAFGLAAVPPLTWVVAVELVQEDEDLDSCKTQVNNGNSA